MNEKIKEMQELIKSIGKIRDEIQDNYDYIEGYQSDIESLNLDLTADLEKLDLLIDELEIEAES